MTQVWNEPDQSFTIGTGVKTNATEVLWLVWVWKQTQPKGYGWYSCENKQPKFHGWYRCENKQPKFYCWNRCENKKPKGYGWYSCKNKQPKFHGWYRCENKHSQTWILSSLYLIGVFEEYTYSSKGIHLFEEYTYSSNRCMESIT